MIKDLDQWIVSFKKNRTPPFATFITEKLMPIFQFPTQGQQAFHAKPIIEIMKVNAFVAKQPENEDDFNQIRGLVAIVLMSEKEYMFMRGANAKISREDMLKENGETV